jgi:plastocyanin
MQIDDLMARARRPAAIFAATAALIGFGTLAGMAALPQYVVSQKGREFQPGQVTIKRGETIQIVNDDADLLHHAYVDADNFKFDSGDEEPGSKTGITFPVTGTFDVLCAIHPKRKLTVTVK